MYDLDHLYRQSSRFFHGVDKKELGKHDAEKTVDRFQHIRSTASDIAATRANRLGGRVQGPGPSLMPTFSDAPAATSGPSKPVGTSAVHFSEAKVTVKSPKAKGEAPSVSFSHPAAQEPTATPTSLPAVPQFSHGGAVEPSALAAAGKKVKAGAAFDAHVLGGVASKSVPAPTPEASTAAPAATFSNPAEFQRGVDHVRRPAPGLNFSG